MIGQLDTATYDSTKMTWFGVAKPVNGAQTAAQCFKNSGLDWEVGMGPCMTTGVGKQPGTIQVPGHRVTFCLIDDGKGGFVKHPLGVVGPLFTLVQNADSFGFTDRAVGTGVAAYVAAGSLDDRRRVFLIAEVPQARIAIKDDEMGAFYIVSNRHDGGGGFEIVPATKCPRCENSMNAMIRACKAPLRFKHTPSIHDRIDAAIEEKIINGTLQYWHQYGDILKKMVDIVCGEKYIVDYLGRLMPIPKKNPQTAKEKHEIILDLYHGGQKGAKEYDALKGHTPYRVWSAMTEYFTHHQPLKPRKADTRSEGERRFDADVYGISAVGRERAFDVLARDFQLVGA